MQRWYIPPFWDQKWKLFEKICKIFGFLNLTLRFGPPPEPSIFINWILSTSTARGELVQQKIYYEFFAHTFGFGRGFIFINIHRKNRYKTKIKLLEVTSFFKSIIMCCFEASTNPTKHHNVSSGLLSCNSKQIYDVKVVYTPFLRSIMKIVWKNVHQFRVSQFEPSLWTSPHSHIIARIELFWLLRQEDIPLKKRTLVLRAPCKHSVSSGRFTDVVSKRSNQVMVTLCEAEVVPKAWYFYFLVAYVQD